MMKLDECGVRLQTAGFSVASAVSFGRDTELALTASRTCFSWKGMVILSQHVVFRQIARPGIQDVRDLGNLGFRFGKAKNRVPLLRGMQFGYVIIPIVIAESVTEAVRGYVLQQPRKRWCVLEFPVVYDQGKDQVHCFQKTGAWGAFFFSDARNIIQRCID